MFIALLLVVVCLIIPYRIAFSEPDRSWEITYYVIDSIFAIDMVLTFSTTFQSSTKSEEVFDRKAIAANYLGGWFFIDLVSIIPFDALI
jgi:hypothetical protein